MYGSEIPFFFPARTLSIGGFVVHPGLPFIHALELTIDVCITAGT